MILLHQKSSLYPQDFQIFVYPSNPLFSILRHCWFYRKSWFITSCKVYGIIMSLNWILRKHRFCNIWWSKYLILILVHGQMWLSQGQLWSTILQGDSFAYAMLITSLYLIWSKGHWEPWSQTGFQNLANHILRIWT